MALDFFAIDIGKHSIKLVECRVRNEDNAELQNLASVAFPRGVENTVPSKDKKEDMEQIASAIKSLVDSSGISSRKVVTALPESVIFTKLFPNMVMLDPAKFEESIYWEAKQFLPIPIEEAQTDWIEIARGKNQNGQETLDVMFIAAPRSTVEAYLYLFELADLELVAVEVESIASSRALRFNYPEIRDSNAMIVDFGAERTDVSVIHNGRLVFSQSISTGSDAFTKAISTDFGLQPIQAAKYKATYGVLENQQDGGKIFNSIKPILDVVLNEVGKILGFIDTRLSYGKPDAVFLSGSGSQMPGLPEYTQKYLNTQIQILNPLKNIKLSGKYADIQEKVAPQGYAIATGLALKIE